MKHTIRSDLPVITDLHKLFIEDTNMLDVRAPVEYVQGAFPHTQNIALLNDEERHEIGIRYKEQGQDEAIQLGATLLTDEKRSQRIAQWQQFIIQNPNGVLYCFRGGMRSKISQTWIAEQTGMEYPRVEGGYKAMRRYLIDSSERLAGSSKFILLGGRTGSGKTRVLTELKHYIDLEGLANHRGSAFGASATPQPTQINFENTLAIEQLKLEAQQASHIILEDEGRNIGACHLPLYLQQAMAESPIVHMEIDNEERLQTSMQEYAVDMLAGFNDVYGEEQGFNYYEQSILENLDKIKKRLGGERHTQLRKLAEQALMTHRKTGSAEAHSAWVGVLLQDYYDPMYDYQLSKKKDRVVFQGSKAEVVEYLRERT